MEQNFKCSGNCLNCLPAQRAYCASQHSYSNMQVLDKMMGIILESKEKIDSIKKEEESVFNIAQSGDGADNRFP